MALGSLFGSDLMYQLISRILFKAKSWIGGERMWHVMG